MLGLKILLALAFLVTVSLSSRLRLIRHLFNLFPNRFCFKRILVNPCLGLGLILLLSLFLHKVCNYWLTTLKPAFILNDEILSSMSCDISSLLIDLSSEIIYSTFISVLELIFIRNNFVYNAGKLLVVIVF